MSATQEIASGLEGVVAFATEIAEPDRDGGVLRYRGVDVEELVAKLNFEDVWGLLTEGPALEPAQWQTIPSRSGNPRADLQAALAQLATRPLIDIDAAQARADLARASALALSYTAQTAGGTGAGTGDTAAERFLSELKGEVDPGAAEAIDAYWITAAEHGMNASTFTARVVASTGADVGAALSAAVGALSGPLHGSAPGRVLEMLEDIEREGDPTRYIARKLDRKERLMGFGHRIYRAEDPRARILRAKASELGARRFELAAEVEQQALEQLRERQPNRVLATNVEYWAAVVLDRADLPKDLFTPLFACARTAGWSAHILEQQREGRLIRPTAVYVGTSARSL